MSKKQKEFLKPDVATGPGTQFILLDVNEDIVLADWNYKEPGTREEIDRLKASIARDKSCGVLAMRELETEDGLKFESVDGNHRVVALRELGWTRVPCENFGQISKAEAITIARRRNHKWFDDNAVKLAALYKDIVIPEIPIDDLLEFMPDTRADIEAMVKLTDFNWNQFSNSQTAPMGSDDKEDAAPETSYTNSGSDFIDVNLKVPVELWERFKEFKVSEEIKSDVQALEYLLEAVQSDE